jgi:hypothetical protein
MASNAGNRGYRLFVHDTGAPAPMDRPEITLDIPFPTRVRATLQVAPEGAPSAEVPALYPDGGTLKEREDDLRTIRPSSGREFALEFSAVLFALFGLFVLWWGRDRASLWLGIFCASFGPPIFDDYTILPDWAMLLASVVADFLFFLSIYAFFEIARTFALEALDERDPVRTAFERAREIALTIVLFAAAINFAQNIGPTVFGESVWIWLERLGDGAKDLAIAGVLGIAPILMLAVGWLRATDRGARERVRITLIMTVVAASGVLVSISQDLARGWPLGFDNTWYTLLFIPIGFVFSIRAYKLVEVKFVLNRILVLTTMTALIAGAITLSETWADNAMKDRLGSELIGWLGVVTKADQSRLTDALRFAVAFTIVLSFSRLHHLLDEFFKALFFRRRDVAVKQLADFAQNRAQFITVREEMLQQAIALVCSAVGARGSAFYEESGQSYNVASTCGDVAWPATAGENDPAFAMMRGGRANVELAALDPTPSVLGSEGIAIRMAVCNRVIGALVVASRVKESEGPYEREELDVLEEVARSVSDALFNLRANETADFVRGVADGSLRGSEALERAASLCARGLPGVDTSLHARAARAAAAPLLPTALPGNAVPAATPPAPAAPSPALTP